MNLSSVLYAIMILFFQENVFVMFELLGDDQAYDAEA